MMGEENIKVAPTTESQILVASNSETKISSLSTLNTTSINEDDLKVYLNYHNSEIKQNEKIYKLARTIIWIGFGVMMLGVLACFLGVTTSAILAACVGAVTEIISGSILAVLSQSTKSKKEYYKQLSLDRECDKYIMIIQDVGLDDEKKFELLNKLIDNYCKRRK